MKSRSFVCTALTLAAATALAPLGQAELKATLVASGISNPTHMAQPPDDERFFVTAMRQGVWIVEDGNVLPQMFLDLTGENLSTQGLKSIAFHPEYQANGRFYVVYMDDTLNNHLVEYTVSATDPYQADPASARHILGPYPQTGVVHNWDLVTFGADGLLYLSTGDGVMSSDLSSNNGQRLDVLAGKLLRIDVDGGDPYAIPADNPFVGVPGAREEIWAYGLRQPWRYDLDPLSGDLYLGDVGNSTAEEINVVEASAGIAGRNFGWRCIEGTACNDLDSCDPCSSPGYTAPAFEFDQDGGRCAVIGGQVYRGAQIPDFFGKYIFADHCSATFWTFEWSGGQMVGLEEIELPTYDVREVTLPTSFARDNAGELYVLDRAGAGYLYRIEDDPCPIRTVCEGELNSTGVPALLEASGTPDVSATDFTLEASQGPPNQNVLFFYGPSSGSVPFGNGTRCVTGTLARLNPPTAFDASGEASHVIDFSNPPAPSSEILAGSKWYFQGWYRDPAAGGAFFNLSGAISVQFCP